VKKKVLLTGGSGFIGKNILESQLAEKYYLFAPTRNELNLTDDKSVKDYFSDKNFDAVIHAACKPGHRNAKDISNIFLQNSKMFFNLLQNQDRFEKLINIGSGAIYDTRNPLSKIPETFAGKNIPQDEHGFCKYVEGKIIEKSSNIVDLRVFGIFGKYEDYAIRFISNALCKAAFDLPITIKQNRKFDYIYVKDLMPILDYFIENNTEFNAYNITPDNSITLVELAEKVLRITGKNLPVIIAQKGMGPEYSGDNFRLKNEISSLSYTPIDEAITELYAWYNQNREKINKEFLLFDK